MTAKIEDCRLCGWYEGCFQACCEDHEAQYLQYMEDQKAERSERTSSERNKDE